MIDGKVKDAPKAKEAICKMCEQVFTVKPKNPNASYCSLSCRGAAGAMARQRSPWRHEELALIEKMIGFHPITSIQSALNKLNKEGGYAERSIPSIHREINRLGGSSVALDDNIPCKIFAQNIGVGKDAVYRWRDTCGMPVRRWGKGKRKTAVSLSKFRKWAKEHEHLLAGLDFMALLWALDDEEWARRLSLSPRINNGFAIKRLDTHQTFTSLRQASKSCFLNPSTLSSYTSQGLARFSAGGIEWELLK